MSGSLNCQMAWWIIDQLVQQGVCHFCIAPGSRSTPLALAAAHHPKAEIHIHYDERGLGFHTLGLAKATKIPAAIIVTSGTAVGNLLPSIMEAHHSHIPLFLLTADRPPELIDAGANQTTDQLKLFQNFTRGELYLPTADPFVTERYVRSAVAQAACLLQKTPGPFHLNWHLRAPLFTPPFPALAEGKAIDTILPEQIPSNPTQLCGNGVIAIGTLFHPRDLNPILQLAKNLKWPIFADILSNARFQSTNEQIFYFDWILKKHPSLKPHTILHFGERLTSKTYLEWAENATRLIHVSPQTMLQDPSRLLTERVISDIVPFCRTAQIHPTPDSWLSQWKEADLEIKHYLHAHFQNSSLCTEAHAFHTFSNHFDPAWALYLGSGMPIRDANHYFFPPSSAGCFSNRGLSGIDGNIASGAGISKGLQTPLVLWIGDQATLHDLNSLPLLNQTKHPVLLIISNNFGGGIFSHLPIAQDTEHFESLFVNAHSWQFASAATLFDLPYYKAESIDGLISAWENAKHKSGVIELITSRDVNFTFHQKLFSSCIA
jgi:2-succinyl-5-enolpyruvyl-6-hydroxy-3-cyclohexene-1-carboxylate synthase